MPNGLLAWPLGGFSLVSWFLIKIWSALEPGNSKLFSKKKKKERTRMETKTEIKCHHYMWLPLEVKERR